MIFSWAIIFIFPFISHYLCKKSSVLNTLGPVTLCYAFGVLNGNSGLFSDITPYKMASEVTIPLAIVLLLFSTDFIGWLKLAKKTIISFALLVFSVTTVTFLVSLFYKSYNDEYWKLGGMLVGVNVGGTPNMSAIGLGLGVKDETFILLNAADLIVGAIYLFIVLSFGPKLLAKILSPYKPLEKTGDERAEDTSIKFYHYLISLVLASITFLLAVFISRLSTGGDDIIIIMLSLSTLSITLSFIPKVRALKSSFILGDYFLLCFCVAIGSMANISNIMNSSPTILLYYAAAMYLSILLHIFLVKLFKIDRDTAIITAIAGIFGPAFIPPIAGALKNKEIIVGGITTGIIGYAVGNYLGFTIAYLLKQF